MESLTTIEQTIKNYLKISRYILINGFFKQYFLQ